MSEEYTRENVAENICQILRKDFNIKHEITTDKQKLPLTSYFFGLNAIQLYQLLMVVEEKYNIYFSAPEIEANGFLTVEDIVRLIQSNV